MALTRFDLTKKSLELVGCLSIAHTTMSATQTSTQAAGSIVADVSLDGYDEEQVRLMEERCILVDENDKAYGEGSKKQCEC